MGSLRIALAQINPSVGDLEGNVRKIVRNIETARGMDADLMVFPELAVTGYPPEDLLMKPEFIRDNLRAIEEIGKASVGITVVVGFVDARNDIYNAAAILHEGKVTEVYHKVYLPNYGVFDEERYFRPGEECLVLELNGVKIGITICEDMWYPGGPGMAEALAGDAEVIVNISASPYHAGKIDWREKMLATRASDNAVAIAYVNLVGGQDELVFDGGSAIFDQRGEVVARASQFEEDLVALDLDVEGIFRQRLHDPRRRKAKSVLAPDFRLRTIELSRPTPGKGKHLIPPEVKPRMHDLEEIYSALVLGTRDYIHKNGFEKVLIALSGGMDSSLTCTIAVDAIGSENVIGVWMPSSYSSEESRADAQDLCSNLDVKLITLPINEIFQSYLRTLKEEFEGIKPDVAEENIQARIRGNILMALSNKFGWLVLTTGNKSETSVGYCTLYGDMAGGFAVIKDVPKTLVYELAKYRNSREDIEVIPLRVLKKEPSAELRPDQKDSDTLPSYPKLDRILKAYVEEDRSFDEITGMGFEKELVREVIRMVDRSEYKRRQSPPGIKITPRAFGKDRRLPITNLYRPFR